MTGSEIIQIVSLFLTAIVSIVTLLVRSRIIALEGEITSLKAVVASSHAIILQQFDTIKELKAEALSARQVNTTRTTTYPPRQQ